MLSTNDMFDRELRNVLNQTSQEEISEEFLGDIKWRLDQLEKKKKRRLFVWFFFGIVIASVLTFGLNGEDVTNIVEAKTTFPIHVNFSHKTKALKRNINSKGNSNLETIMFQSSLRNQDPRISKKGISSFAKEESLNRGAIIDHEHLLESTSQHADSSSVQNNKITSVMPVDESAMNTNQIHQTTRVIDSTELTTKSMVKNSNNESLTLTTNPEMAEKINNQKWMRSFGFYCGMSGVLSSFQTNDVALQAVFGASNALKYRELRSTQERSTSSIDLSLRYRLAKENMVLQTGVDFFEWGEQIRYDYSFAYDGINRYSYLSLPFYLGYRRAYQSFEWSANIGCSMGHVIQSKGQYIQPDLVTLALENARTWSLNGLAQLEFSYIIYRYRFSLAPTYRMSVGNVVNSTYTKNRYFSVGIQIGMFYQF